MLRKVQDAMRDSIALQMNYATAAERAAYMVELDHEEAVEDIRRKWQAFEIEYIGMSDAERQRLTENFTTQGIAFEVMENGKLSLAKQAAKDIAAVEQQYAEETANFYIQCRDLMAAKDEAFRQNSWTALQQFLTRENAERINAYNTQQNAMQRYYENWLQTHKTTNELMADSILESQGAFETFFTNILKGQKNFGDAFMDLLNGLLDAIVKSIAETMAAQVVNQFLNWIMPGLFSGGGVVSGGFNTYGAASNALGIRLGSFATGGMISGPGTSTSDSIPAMLSNGEYVINAEAVRRIGVPRLNALNSGVLPHFADGGYVGSGSYGNGMPPVVINLHNETGMAMEAEQTGSAFDGERWVLGVVLKGITNNTMGLRSMLQGGKA